jgi:hypothetical protein
MNATNTTTKSGGKATAASGCGCGGKAPSGGSKRCTCADPPPACQTSGVLRPNFFAGQLLTEDDLQQITVYQTAKRKLTNRFVFGTGVVCGLEVVAGDASAPGNVTVKPGYALDCCGNDILLTCECPLDINAMIRAAKLDCNDPCGDSENIRKYLLYVRYTESLSEQVSAYSPNGATNCGYTRVQESCTFELQCAPKKHKSPDSLVSQLRHVLTVQEAELGYGVDLERWDDSSKNKHGLIPPAGSDPFKIKLVDDDATALLDAGSEIDTVTKTFAVSVRRDSWTEEKLNHAVERLWRPARTVARFLFLADADRKIDPPPPPASATGGTSPTSTTPITPATPTGPTTPTTPATPTTTPIDMKKTLDQLPIVRDKLAKAAKTLASLVRSSFTAAAQTRANLLVREILRWTDSTEDGLKDMRNRIDIRLFIRDESAKSKPQPYSFHRYKLVIHDLGREHFWPKPLDVTDFDSEILDAIGGQASQVRERVDRESRKKFCDTLNPPCTPCEDLCVLLASVEMEHCKVFSICNLVRTIIISPAALGYWVPLQDLLEKLCCCRSGDDNDRDVFEGVFAPFRTYFGVDCSKAAKPASEGAVS